MPSELTQTAKSASIIGLTAGAGAAIGFALQLIIAYKFGASEATDAYFMAHSTSEMLSKLLLGGSLASVFLPLFVKHLARGEKQAAWELALNLLHLAGLLFLLLIVLLGFFAPSFVSFVAPGFSESTQALTTNLLRVLLPSFLFLFLVELMTSMLHALKIFSLPAALRVISPLTIIIILVLLAPYFGIYALALGAVASGLIQFLFIAAGLGSQNFSYRFILNPWHPELKHLLYLTYPFLASMLITQGAGLVYRVLVSDLPTGSLSALKYSEKITQFVAIIFLISITTVIFPLLSEKASRKDYLGIRSSLAQVLRLIALITVPLTIGIALLRQPLLKFAFERGSFSPEDTALTSAALLFLIIGLFANGVSSAFGYTVLALQQTRAAVAVTIASQAIAIALFVLLVPPLAHAGLALASSLVPLSIALLYFLYLTRFIPELHRVFLHPAYLKIALLAVLLFAVIYFTRTLTHDLPLLLQLIIPTLTGSFIFFGGAHLWKIEEMTELTAIARRKLKLDKKVSI
jgi:putative peptidoglycan lipid II flippase